MELEELEELEGPIRAMARRHFLMLNDPAYTIDDFAQIGRIVAIKVINKKPDAPIPYILKAVGYSMKNQIAYEKREKRKPKGHIVVSIEKPLNEEGLTLNDLLEHHGWVETKEEIMQSLIEGIKRIYGRFYIRNIRETRGLRQTVKTLIRTVIDEVEHIPINEIPQKVDFNFFKERGLEPILWVFYRNSPFLAVRDAYPSTFMPWEFNRVHKGFWSGKKGFFNSLEAIKWLLEKKGVKTPEDATKLGYDNFIEFGLGRMLQLQFGHSSFLALKTQFPELRPWKMKTTPKGFFDKLENRVVALTSFLSDHKIPPILECNPEEVYEYGLRRVVTKEALEGYGLRGLLDHYDNGIYRMFCEAFPGKILPWTLTSVKEAWKDEPRKTAAEAVRWLFERYLGIPIEDIPAYAACALFWRVGFSGILTSRKIGFNSSPYAAVDNAYPGIFHPKEFQRHRKTIILETKELKKPWRKKVLNASYP